jgi:flagella basal body P-ring formation protein FlgA
MTRPLCYLFLSLAVSGLGLQAATLPASEGETGVCTDVSSDQISGGDLARAFPALQGIPPEVRIAPAPIPGGSRVFSQTEIGSLAARFGFREVTPVKAICFRVPTAPLNRQAVMAAMRRALPSMEATIELADVSPEPAPPGVIQFPVEGLTRPALPDSPAMWRGEVVAGSRHFRIWVRAKVSMPITRVVAVEELKPGQAIQPQQLRAEQVEGFPLAKTNAVTVASATGLMPLRLVPAGSEIRFENLVKPFDVARGDLVRVEVRLGKARLSLKGRAESAGRLGDMIPVLNPESNRTFQARVEGKDTVSVDPHGSGTDK